MKKLALCILTSMCLSVPLSYGASSTCSTDQWYVTVYGDKVDIPTLLTAFELVETNGFHVEGNESDPSATSSSIGTRWIEFVQSFIKVGDPQNRFYFGLIFDRRMSQVSEDQIVQSNKDAVISSLGHLPGIEVHCREPEVGITISN